MYYAQLLQYIFAMLILFWIPFMVETTSLELCLWYLFVC